MGCGLLLNMARPLAACSRIQVLSILVLSPSSWSCHLFLLFLTSALLDPTTFLVLLDLPVSWFLNLCPFLYLLFPIQISNFYLFPFLFFFLVPNHSFSILFLGIFISFSLQHKFYSDQMIWNHLSSFMPSLYRRFFHWYPPKKNGKQICMATTVCECR